MGGMQYCRGISCILYFVTGDLAWCEEAHICLEYVLIGLKHCVMSNNIWALCSDGLHTLVEYVLEKKGNCSVLRAIPVHPTRYTKSGEAQTDCYSALRI